MCPPKNLSDQMLSFTPECHDLIDQQLHGIYGISGHIVKVLKVSLSRQQDVVHTPNGHHMVIEADGHTGTEKSMDDGGFLAGMKSTDVNADSLLHFIGPLAVRNF